MTATTPNFLGLTGQDAFWGNNAKRESIIIDSGVRPEHPSFSDRTDKSLAVRQAGGAGMVLYDSPDGSLNADLHFVPSVHVDNASGLAIKAYAATEGATASINQATITNTAQAPFKANFSSRGPLQAGNSNLLRPDLIAPGVDILAGAAPPNNDGKLFDPCSGTSMSSPHAAGLAALLRERHPGWSPMAIKSALMTSGSDMLDGGTPAPNTKPILIFRQGAGHVRPNLAVNPGLKFDSGLADWSGFIGGVQPGEGCAGVTPIHPSDLNVASIAVGALAGSKKVTRRVTNVSGNPTTFTSSISGISGMKVSVSPASLQIGDGETQSFTVTITGDGASMGNYVGGQLTWSHGTTSVRIPMVVRPILFSAPAEVNGSYAVGFGYAGAFSASPRGLVASDVTAGTVTQDPAQTFNPNDPSGTVAIQVAIPADTTLARFAIFAADVAAGSDVDLYVVGPTGETVGQGTAGGSDEAVSLSNPAAGTYTVYVHGRSLRSGSTPFRLHTWKLANSATGNMTVMAPASATQGATGAINLVFSGPVPATKYLGSIVYGGTAGLPAPTIVRVDTP